MFEKPAVETDIGSLPELVANGENVFVIHVADVNALADKLHRITINAELRRKMDENARKHSKDFAISKMVTNILVRTKKFSKVAR